MRRTKRLIAVAPATVALAFAAVGLGPTAIAQDTTGLDEANEREVMSALNRLAEHRTTLLITHDLRAAAKMDQVILLDSGKIAEQGAPDQLLVTDGRFREMFNLQSNDGAPPLEEPTG